MKLLSDQLQSKIKVRRARLWYQVVGARQRLGFQLKPFTITGPPRSGTSLLAALLSRHDCVKAVNEPTLFTLPRVAHADPGLLLSAIIAATARDIDRHGVIRNKVDRDNPDAPVSDTFHGSWEWQRMPVAVDRTRPFCVGVKWPLPIMDNLGPIHGAMPDLHTLIIFRRPEETIRSWHNTFKWFERLFAEENAYPMRLKARVPKTNDAIERSAHLWRVLAEEAVEHAVGRPEQIRIIRYEHLLDAPGAMVRTCLRHIGAQPADQAIDTSDVKPQKRDYAGFSDEQQAMISAICSEAEQAVTAVAMRAST